MSTEEDARKLFVAGLPDSMTEDVLRQLFEATGGTVRSLSLPRDRGTGRPRGFGFVTLASPEEAVAARESLDGSMQAGRSISVRPFKSEAPRRAEAAPAANAVASGAGRTLYVGNLPYEVTAEDVEQLFTGGGARDVVRVHLPTAPDGRLRGFGFVTMGSSEAANEAIVALRSIEMGGRRLVINVAHPKGERADRSERPRPRPRDEAQPPSPSPSRAPEPDPAMLEALGEPRRAPEGRRRAVKPERSDSDKRRKKRGGGERGPARRRKRHGDWDDWDED